MSNLTSPTISDPDLHNRDGSGIYGDGEEKIELPIHTFLMENQAVVITVPDVHRIVDFLDEQSASLDYHFRKLGIAKSRFTYAQLHQLRRLNVIKRPTVCTYIAKHDVNRLLKMYETERNRHRMARVCFLAPVQLVRGTPPQQQVGNPKYIKPGAEKLPNSLHNTPVTPDYVGGALGVGIHGTATTNGGVVSPPLPPNSNNSSVAHHNNNPQHSSFEKHHTNKQSSSSPTHAATTTSPGFAKPSPFGACDKPSSGTVAAPTLPGKLLFTYYTLVYTKAQSKFLNLS